MVRHSAHPLHYHRFTQHRQAGTGTPSSGRCSAAATEAMKVSNTEHPKAMGKYNRDFSRMTHEKIQNFCHAFQ